MNEIPRRAYIHRMVPVELKIREAMLAVEAMPADVRLTDAVVLLEQARTKVSDYVDSLPPPLVAASQALVTPSEKKMDYGVYSPEIERELSENYTSLAFPPSPPQETLRQAAEFVVKTFRTDEAAGYHGRDRQFVIDILEKSLASPPKQTNPCPKCGTWLWDDPRPCWNCARLAASPPAQEQEHPASPIESPTGQEPPTDSILANRLVPNGEDSGQQQWAQEQMAINRALDEIGAPERDGLGPLTIVGRCWALSNRWAKEQSRLSAALPPAHGWQPIETAPKNFMPVLLVWHPPVGRPDPVVVLARWGCRTHLHLSKWHDCPNHPDCQMQWDSYAGEMSHWMPLPAPPIAHGWHAEKEKL